MSWARRVLHVLVFPMGLFRLFTWPTRRWRAQGPSRSSKLGWALFDTVVVLAMVLPASLFLSMELVIAANRAVVGENSDYRIPSDFEQGVAELGALPGTPVRDPGRADPNRFGTPAERHALALRYAPVILLETSYRPMWDLPVAVDFDGNWEPRDNPASGERADSLPAVVYGELTAVTEDALYLTYTLYRIRDYDHPVRQWISRWTHHDSDNEGFHVRVDRRTGRPESVETWFHNRFLVCNRDGTSTGSEVVRGRLHLEGERPVIFSQSQGHGVRCVQSGDLQRLDRLKVLRPSPDGRADAPRADRTGESDLRYRLEGFEEWYAQAPHPDDAPLFSGTVELGPGLTVGQFIAGLDREDVGVWSRPKPMWAWDDGWDTIPVAVWHFLPSLSFEAHQGGALSHDYLFNGPARAIFGISGNDLRDRMDVDLEFREGDKWEGLESRGDVGRQAYWSAATLLVGRYVTRVFMALG